MIDENSRSAYYGVCGELLILDHCTENAENDCEFNPLWIGCWFEFFLEFLIIKLMMDIWSKVILSKEGEIGKSSNSLMEELIYYGA